jgi:lipoyl-dependent peroxiredoxin
MLDPGTERGTGRMIMALDSKASAHWEGSLMEGSGTTRLDSSGNGQFSVDWKARTEEHGSKTSPEELIAAAHAACFSMALSNGLAKGGTPPTSLDVEATATFVPGSGITGMKLVLSGDVPGLDDDGFRQAAETAKENCPVSQALKGNVPITLEMR